MTSGGNAAAAADAAATAAAGDNGTESSEAVLGGGRNMSQTGATTTPSTAVAGVGRPSRSSSPDEERCTGELDSGEPVGDEPGEPASGELPPDERRRRPAPGAALLSSLLFRRLERGEPGGE